MSFKNKHNDVLTVYATNANINKYFEVTSTKGNKGQVAEPVFACAYFMFFYNFYNNGGSRGNLTEEDMQFAIKHLQKNEVRNGYFTIGTTVKDANDNDDKLILKTNITKNAYDLLFSEGLIDSEIMRNTLQFINSTHADKAEKMAEAFYNNNTADEMVLDSDGSGTDAKLEKADVKLIYTADYENNKDSTAKAYSLKVGSKDLEGGLANDWEAQKVKWARFGEDFVNALDDAVGDDFNKNREAELELYAKLQNADTTDEQKKILKQDIGKFNAYAKNIKMTFMKAEKLFNDIFDPNKTSDEDYDKKRGVVKGLVNFAAKETDLENDIETIDLKVKDGIYDWAVLHDLTDEELNNISVEFEQDVLNNNTSYKGKIKIPTYKIFFNYNNKPFMHIRSKRTMVKYNDDNIKNIMWTDTHADGEESQYPAHSFSGRMMKDAGAGALTKVKGDNKADLGQNKHTADSTTWAKIDDRKEKVQARIKELSVKKKDKKGKEKSLSTTVNKEIAKLTNYLNTLNNKQNEAKMAELDNMLMNEMKKIK